MTRQFQSLVFAREEKIYIHWKIRTQEQQALAVAGLEEAKCQEINAFKEMSSALWAWEETLGRGPAALGKLWDNKWVCS